MGKHEDFIFEGAKSKPGVERKLVLRSESKQSEKSSSKSKEVHKEHHQAITKYVFIGAIVLLLGVLLSKGGYLNFGKNVSQENVLETKVAESQQNLPVQTANPCGELDGTPRDECLRNINLQAAILADNVELCKDEFACKDDFYLHSAKNKNDILLCDKIKYVRKIEECQAQVKANLLTVAPEKAVELEITAVQHFPDEMDLSACKDLNEFDASKCLDNAVIAKALASNDITFCQLASDKLFCHGFWLKNRAIVFSNKDFCNRIVHAKLKEECLEQK